MVLFVEEERKRVGRGKKSNKIFLTLALFAKFTLGPALL